MHKPVCGARKVARDGHTRNDLVKAETSTRRSSTHKLAHSSWSHFRRLSIWPSRATFLCLKLIFIIISISFIIYETACLTEDGRFQVSRTILRMINESAYYVLHTVAAYLFSSRYRIRRTIAQTPPATPLERISLADKSNDDGNTFTFPFDGANCVVGKPGRRQYRRESESTIKRHSIVMQLLFK